MFNKILNFFQPTHKSPVNAKHSVLVVEDTDVDRSLIEKTLAREGYQVLIAKNGVEGLEIAKTQKPNAIVLDCEMPLMGGIEMCQRLRADKNLKNIPVIFLTSIDTPKNVVECFEAEATNFLTKPINSRTLIQEVKNVLKENIIP